MKPLRALAVIRRHANPHAFVEIVDDCMHLGRYTRACEYLPQQLSVDRVARFLQIDGAFASLVRALATGAREQHIYRWSCGAEAALFFRE